MSRHAITSLHTPDHPHRLRWWTVYDRAGTRLQDVHVSRHAIRETMPEAWIDCSGGRVVVGLRPGELPAFLHPDPVTLARGESGVIDTD